jgi:hypothetical protein
MSPEPPLLEDENDEEEKLLCPSSDGDLFLRQLFR